MTDEAAEGDHTEDVGAESTTETPPDAGETEADVGSDAAVHSDPDTDAAADDADASSGPTLADRVAEYDDELADEVGELERRVVDLETELAARDARVEELEGALKRTQADFQNYKKRSKKRQAEIKERATEDFVERVVTVRDNLVRALGQDEDADIRPGVRSTLEEFDRILADENVETIDPEPGDDVDPQRHEVMMRVDSDQPTDTVADVYQPGYEMAEKVLRAAQVTVSKGDDE